MAEDNKVADNPLELSDEEMMNMDFPPEEAEDNSTESDEQNEDGDDDTSDADESTDDDAEDESDDDSDDESDEDDDNSTDSDKSDDDKEDDSDSDKESDTKENTKSEDDKASKKDDASIDYKAEYNKILAPFRANGKEIKVDNIKDAIDLMRMGANYHKKMAGLKPAMKLVKMLQNNDLLDEGKLGYLIDLANKDKDAVTKLIKDSGINPLDIDVEKESTYVPKNHKVDDREIELDNVLDDLKGSPEYKKTINVISNEWDEASRQLVVENPSLIPVINDHIANGVYDQIMGEVENQRRLGKMSGVSDIEAYKQVGAAMQERQAYTSQQQAKSQQDQANTVEKSKVTSTSDSKKRKNRKMAASTTKSTKSKSKSKGDYNPLEMDDDEFDKLSTSSLY